MSPGASALLRRSVPWLTGDSAGNLTIEGFTLMIIFKNMFSFMLTWYAYDWLIQSGFRDVLVIIASVQVGVCLLSIPLCECLPRCRK